ncbi:hypothetical protein Runsl_5809 (plasmid) [Runella slithyformis DSM 19594]|uniref:Uncharacterized protein n=1 Tax=Runella slithyformis (strain ATCC 29530 / DSM 19594 / LMG 11500 / NCIMB 11436 / LSU 4) TaxID=761193 RepID=A0A7U3ZRU6_RUNSL|nr:hypothetical protein Runsl_5809 [Runella slithyformis DSM 19594]
MKLYDPAQVPANMMISTERISVDGGTANCESKALKSKRFLSCFNNKILFRSIEYGKNQPKVRLYNAEIQLIVMIPIGLYFLKTLPADLRISQY